MLICFNFIALNGKEVLNDELEKIWKEATVPTYRY
jgi:hypothetical protein